MSTNYLILFRGQRSNMAPVWAHLRVRPKRGRHAGLPIQAMFPIGKRIRITSTIARSETRSSLIFRKTGILSVIPADRRPRVRRGAVPPIEMASGLRSIRKIAGEPFCVEVPPHPVYGVARSAILTSRTILPQPPHSKPTSLQPHRLNLTCPGSTPA